MRRCQEALENGAGREAPCLHEAVEARELLREAAGGPPPFQRAVLDKFRGRWV